MRSVFLLVLLSLAQGTAGAVPREASHESLARWAEYYARVYQVPVELVDAVIEVESGWDPYAAWRARVKAMFSLQRQSASELLT